METVLAVDMEALEKFGVFEGLEADGTGQLILQLLESLIGYSLRFSHSFLLLDFAVFSLDEMVDHEYAQFTVT